MRNITISLDDDLLKKEKRIAIDRDTSFTGLVREYPQDLVAREERSLQLRIEALDSLFSDSKAVVGEKTWIMPH